VSDGTDTTTEGAPQLTSTEQASVEVGQRGFSEAPATTPVTPEAPQVPEKFLKDGKPDYDALVASYTELEKRLGAAPAPAAPAEETPAAPAASADGKIAKAPAAEEPAANPLTSLLDAARSDFTTSQAFSEETATKLAEAGIPTEVQQVYLKGLQALAQQSVGTIHGYVGGEQNYAALTQWAAEKLSDAELDAYNSALDNEALRENAVRGLYARFQAARPSEGRQVTTANSGATAGDTYQSRDELVADQKNPKYATDARFRNEVMAKLQRSQAAGFRVQPQRMFDSVYTHRR